jgi:hypothetical protein
MQLETETKKLEQEVERLLEQLTEVQLREGMARLHEVAESQADRRALNREQEKLVQMQQSDFPSNSVHARWDEETHAGRPEEIRQQKWNRKQNQKRKTVPSRSTESLRE